MEMILVSPSLSTPTTRAWRRPSTVKRATSSGSIAVLSWCANVYPDFLRDAYPMLTRQSERPDAWPGLFRNALIFQKENGAAEWNRTIDLTLTKGMLYRLSYGSDRAPG